VIPGLETERLLLRPLELSDAEQIQQIFPHWEIVRYLNNAVPWPYPPNGALTYCRDVALPAMGRGEEWHWTLRLRTGPQQIIGQISLVTKPNNNRGFWLGRPWQNKGLMSEAVNVITDYWFNTLGFPILRAPKALPNLASRRISEKNGMRIVAHEERDYVSGRLLTEIWEITADEWRAHRTKPAAANRH
jgi:[ribosomal protein S5]-alanine N-acetyltransferase